MNPLYDSLISASMKRYGVPEWTRPYIYKYAKESNINAIKHAISFINFRRKKGEVTNRHVRLPNGVLFDIKDVIHILNQFHYGLEAMGGIAKKWSGSQSASYNHTEFSKYFLQVSKAREKHARALRNLVEGLGYQIGEPTKYVIDVFDSIGKLEDWNDRIIATNILIRDAYSRPFGFIFYKVFYPVSPEFMRSLGKVFTVDDEQSVWADSQIRKIILDKKMDENHIIELSESLLIKIYKSIQSEMRLARNSGIYSEAKLLRDISIAYPLHTLDEFGIAINIEREMKKIMDNK